MEIGDDGERDENGKTGVGTEGMGVIVARGRAR